MLIKENGRLMVDGGPLSGKILYIFGIQELPLSRSTAFTVSPLQHVKGAIIAWGGDTAASFKLSWSLTAGFDHPALQDRNALLQQIKLAQALGASSGPSSDGVRLQGPPKVRLIVPGHINCLGVCREISTTEKGPWDTRSLQLPTKCDFSIEFVPFQAYDPERIVDPDALTWTAPDIASRFYQA